MRPMNHDITVHLPPEIIETLRCLAVEAGLTTEELIQHAVEKWMEANAESSSDAEQK